MAANTGRPERSAVRRLSPSSSRGSTCYEDQSDLAGGQGRHQGQERAVHGHSLRSGKGAEFTTDKSFSPGLVTAEEKLPGSGETRQQAV